MERCAENKVSFIILSDYSDLIIMICPFCGSVNQETQKFCGNCGKLLQQLKPSEKTKEFDKYITSGIFILILAIVVLGILLSWNFIFVESMGKPSVHVGEISSTFNIWDGTRTFNIQVYNSGNAVANNVYVTLTVFNSDKSKTLATKRLFVGNIEQGNTRTISSTIQIPDSSIVYTAAIG